MSLAKVCDAFWLPFRSDCEDLLGRFQRTESVRFEEFAAVWRSMDFSSLFNGMTTRQEKRAFSRLTFATVYDYFLPPFSFQIRVGALYMFYGLYHTQPPVPKEKIWIALKDWVNVQKFISDAISCWHLDVLYIFRKLESEKAFLYTAMPKQLTFDAKRRVPNKAFNEEFQDRPAKVAELLNANTLEEIANVQTHYERIKQALSVGSSVSVTTINLTAKLQECTLEFQQWQEKNPKKKDSCAKVKESSKQSDSSTRADLLASIKSKSYGHATKASKSRRHRQVEMDTSDTDYMPELPSTRKKQTSLRARTWENLGDKDEKRQHWLLTSKEEDKTALKRSQQRSRFKW